MVAHRRLKSCTKRRFYIIVSGFSCCIIVLIYFFYSINRCYESDIPSKIDKICENFILSYVRGDLCHDICLEKSVDNFQCGNGIYNNHRFIVADKTNEKVMLKQIKTNKRKIQKLYWKDKQKHKKYPSRIEFTKLIQRTLFFNYNMTLTSDKLAKLLAFIDNRNGEINQDYMELVWRFIHSNEYILANLMETEEIFSKVYGICGDYYAQEYVDSLVQNIEAGDISLYEWKTRIKASILILDYVEELNQYQTPLAMCDVTVLYFGISDDRLKYHDAGSVYTQTYIDKFLSSANPCRQDEDCSFRNCQSKCDLEQNLCISKQMNNNLHLICDKVFKGYSYTPGILVTSFSSTKLLSLLDRCVNPKLINDIDIDRPFGPSKTLRDELYAELASIYEILVTKN